MIDWIDLRRINEGRNMEGKYLCVIVVVALVCICAMVVYAISQGIDGVILGSALSIFGVIIGAIAKTIYEKKTS